MATASPWWSSSRTKRLLRGARIPSIAKRSGSAESGGLPNTGITVCDVARDYSFKA
jgi:hypothetical protein